jgi:hypothetical protein
MAWLQALGCNAGHTGRNNSGVIAEDSYGIIYRRQQLRADTVDDKKLCRPAGTSAQFAAMVREGDGRQFLGHLVSTMPGGDARLFPVTEKICG